MNRVELSKALEGNPKWTRFVEKLITAMTDEFKIDGVTVLLRELNAEERIAEEHEVLTFDHERQLFEFAVSSSDHCPTPWKVADRIEHFLNPDVEHKSPPKIPPLQ